MSASCSKRPATWATEGFRLAHVELLVDDQPVPERIGPRHLPEGHLEIYDGGADGVASTQGDNTLFEVGGLFFP